MINNNYIIPPYLFQEPEFKKKQKFSLLLALPTDLTCRLTGWLSLPDVTTLCITLKASPSQLWKEARSLLTNAEISRIQEPSLLEGQIECLRYLAGIGNVEKINKVLLKINGSLFPDLSNPPQEEGAYKHPGYKAFCAMGEMACLENKPEVIKALLENPSFQTLCQEPQKPIMRRGGQFAPLPPRIQEERDRYYYIHSLSMHCKDIPLVFAKICCTQNHVECLRVLYEKSFKKLADNWQELEYLSKQHNAEESRDLVMYNIDTSEPPNW